MVKKMKVVLTNGLFNLVFEHSKTSCGYVERMVDSLTGKKISLKHLDGVSSVQYAIKKYLELGFTMVNAQP